MKTNRAHEKMQKRKREELKFTKTSKENVGGVGGHEIANVKTIA